MNKTKKICYLAVLTALYVVLSAFLKFNLIGNIMVDLGYIAFAFALCEFGIYGTAVGAIGCALESVLFSAYGFSVSWFIANAVIGIGCGIAFAKSKNIIIRIAAIIAFCAIGLIGAKTVIECALYAIPYAVKIPKNAIGFAVDSIAMVIGCVLHERLTGKRKLG